MCDTFRPMHPTKAALGFDDPAYPESWKGAAVPTGGTLHHVNLNGRARRRRMSNRTARGVAPARMEREVDPADGDGYVDVRGTSRTRRPSHDD